MTAIRKPSTNFVFYFKVWKKVPSVLDLHAENECLFVNPCELQPREKKNITALLVVLLLMVAIAMKNLMYIS